MIKIKDLIKEDNLFVSINPTGEDLYKYELFLQNSTKADRKKYFGILGAVVVKGDYDLIYFTNKGAAEKAKNKIDKKLKKDGK